MIPACDLTCSEHCYGNAEQPNPIQPACSTIQQHGQRGCGRSPRGKRTSLTPCHAQAAPKGLFGSAARWRRGWSRKGNRMWWQPLLPSVLPSSCPVAPPPHSRYAFLSLPWLPTSHPVRRLHPFLLGQETTEGNYCWAISKCPAVLFQLPLPGQCAVNGYLFDLSCTIIEELLMAHASLDPCQPKTSQCPRHTKWYPPYPLAFQLLLPLLMLFIPQPAFRKMEGNGAERGMWKTGKWQVRVWRHLRLHTLPERKPHWTQWGSLLNTIVWQGSPIKCVWSLQNISQKPHGANH